MRRTIDRSRSWKGGRPTAETSDGPTEETKSKCSDLKHARLKRSRLKEDPPQGSHNRRGLAPVSAGDESARRDRRGSSIGGRGAGYGGVDGPSTERATPAVEVEVFQGECHAAARKPRLLLSYA